MSKASNLCGKELVDMPLKASIMVIVRHCQVSNEITTPINKQNIRISCRKATLSLLRVFSVVFPCDRRVVSLVGLKISDVEIRTCHSLFYTSLEC